jgi:hypothetical protein
MGMAGMVPIAAQRGLIWRARGIVWRVSVVVS